MNKQWIITLIAAASLATVATLLWLNYGKGLVDKIFSEDKQQVVTSTVNLISPFKSNSSPSAVLETLDKMQLSFTTEQLDVSLGQDTPRRKETITAEAFTHYNLPGRLTLHFLNEQLYETVFEPQDSEAYARIMRNKMGLRPNRKLNGRSERVKGAQRIASNVYFANSKVGRSLRTQAFILWQDTKIIASYKTQ